MAESTPTRNGSGSGNSRRGRRGRGRGGGGRRRGTNHPQKAPKVAILARADSTSKAWADRIEAHLTERVERVSRFDVTGDAGLTDVVKDARGHGAHRVLVVGDADFVRWASQAMVGSLMPLAPILIPGSGPLFGHTPLNSSGWTAHVEGLLHGRFDKVDLAMGTVKPFLHQMIAGFPVDEGRPSVTWSAFFNSTELDLQLEIDRSHVEGRFWCIIIANADWPRNRIHWAPGADLADQSLDLILVRPRPLWQKWQFLRALRKGTHGALPGIIRFRCNHINIRSETPWTYTADGGPAIEAANPLILEARAEKLRLVAPPEA